MMHTYNMHVYRKGPDESGSIAGIFDDIESSQQTRFESFADLIEVLADSIRKGQIDPPKRAPCNATPNLLN